MSAMERVVDRLDRVQRNGTTTLASCPVHDHGKGNGDRNPSLSVAQSDGKVLLHCMSGCHVQDVMTAIGLDWPDLFDDPITNDRGVLVASWTYQDKTGAPYAIAERWQTAQGKRFVQRLPGADRPGLPKDFKPALYRLPEVLAAAKANQPVWFCEGEKCCSALSRLGVLATTAPAGVNGWRDYYATWLQGVEVVNIVADNDETGRAYAAKVAASLRGAEIPVKTWAVGVPFPKADVWDHVVAGLGLDDLKPIRLNPIRPKGSTQAELLAESFPPITWVIENLLPAGLAILAGPPKLGKSEIVMDWAMSVAAGESAMHSPSWEVTQGSVLYLALDNDSMQRTQARVRAICRHRGFPTDLPIEYHCEWPTGDAGITACLEWCADERDDGRTPVMIVADTLARVEPEFEGDGRRSAYLETTAKLAKWAQMATQQNLALLAVHHDRKAGDEDWVNRLAGSRGITASAHTLFLLDAKRGEPTGRLRAAGRDIETDDHGLDLECGFFWLSKDRPNRGWVPTVVK